MRRAEYDAIRRRIEARYRKEREALEIIWSLANEGDEQPELSEPPRAEEPASPVPVENPAGSSTGGEPETNGEVGRDTLETFSESPAKRARIPVLPEVRNLIREIEGDIKQNDIRRMLSQKFPDEHVVASSVSGALKRLLDAGELELVSKGGAASEPYIYRRVRPDAVVRESTTNEETPVGG